ncbi:hypothetical protein PIB30_095805 [Stylosanthes scabra]|uniref:Uncharacterized protein n=1 Tax=Stylosanthes scabra TaxID=79078 RepID=A0ABU6WU28_9FABA|nr:hypothetical protein [Stylosanthes scabra]
MGLICSNKAQLGTPSLFEVPFPLSFLGRIEPTTLLESTGKDSAQRIVIAPNGSSPEKISARKQSISNGSVARFPCDVAPAQIGPSKKFEKGASTLVVEGINKSSGKAMSGGSSDGTIGIGGTLYRGGVNKTIRTMLAWDGTIRGGSTNPIRGYPTRSDRVESPTCSGAGLLAGKSQALKQLSKPHRCGPPLTFASCRRGPPINVATSPVATRG